MMSMNLNVNDADYCCIINRISKNYAINLLKNVDLTEKKRNIIELNKFIITYKNGSRNY